MPSIHVALMRIDYSQSFHHLSPIRHDVSTISDLEEVKQISDNTQLNIF